MENISGEERGVVLVTGASGFTGSTAVDYLLQYGYPVLATDLPDADFRAAREHQRFMKEHPERYRGVSLDIHPADLTDTTSLKQLFRTHKVQYLMHPAALFDVGAPRETLWKVNVEGTKVLLETAGKYAPEMLGMVVWSTCSVYGPPKSSALITEDCAPDPQNHYAESKLAQEEAVLEFHRGGLPVVIVRPASVYGPRGTRGLTRYLTPLAWGRHFPMVPLPGKGDNAMSYVHVDDVVGAAMHLVYAAGHQSVAGQAFNVADDTPITTKDVLAEMADMLQVARPFVPLPRQVFKAYEKLAPYGHKLPLYNLEREDIPYMFRNVVVDNSKLKETGYTPKYAETSDGLRGTIDWFARHRKLPNLWYITHPKWRSLGENIPPEERPFADYALPEGELP